jgi:hypothetical protein
MWRGMDRVDVTAQIKAIELLKCGMLSDLAALYENLRKPTDAASRDEPLVSLLIGVYLLARRLGLDFNKLDGAAVLTLRKEILDGSADADMEKLIKYLGRDVP